MSSQEPLTRRVPEVSTSLGVESRKARQTRFASREMGEVVTEKCKLRLEPATSGLSDSDIHTTRFDSGGPPGWPSALPAPAASTSSRVCRRGVSDCVVVFGVIFVGGGSRAVSADRVLSIKLLVSIRWDLGAFLGVGDLAGLVTGSFVRGQVGSVYLERHRQREVTGLVQRGFLQVRVIATAGDAQYSPTYWPEQDVEVG